MNIFIIEGNKTLPNKRPINMSTCQHKWANQWRNPAFKKSIFLAVGILLLIALCFPIFFSVIQRRQGLVLVDRLLHAIPAYDVSVWIFIVLYAMISLIIFRMRKSPILCMTMTWAYIFLCLTRLLSISLVSLDPPEGLIDLKDPFSIIFYHTETITKDLFFSGHVSTIFLIGLCLTGKREKIIAFIASAIMGALVLVQHIHYTLDVVAAPLFSYLFWYMGTKVTSMICSVKYKYEKEAIHLHNPVPYTKKAPSSKG